MIPTPSKPLDISPEFPGFNTVLMGPSGTGKTHSIKTLVDTGLEVFCLFLEPGVEVLVGAYADEDKPLPPNLHYHYVQPRNQGFSTLQKSAKDIAAFDLAGLARMKDIKRSENNALLDAYTVLNDFVDQRTGMHYGPVDQWTNGAALVIDSLSALITAVWGAVVGSKTVRDMAEWGIVQTQVMSIIHKLTTGCICNFVLIAHVERDTDPILGGTKLVISAPGKAITATITQPFSDVILTVREGKQFFWDTANSMADVKTRNLPIAAKIPADFGQIVSKWEKRARAARQG